MIALQICIMRIFQVGSWAHFGSLVVSLAMLGFGLTSAVMCINKEWFDRHWQGVAAVSLLLFGPLTVASNLIAQQIPFNAIFLISDPMQKWRLFGNFMLYMLPFLAGAFFLGTVFLKANRIFGRVYFADLSGAGLCGLAFLVAMYVMAPENLIVAPLLLWLAGSLLWFAALSDRRGALWIAVVAAASIPEAVRWAWSASASAVMSRMPVSTPAGSSSPDWTSATEVPAPGGATSIQRIPGPMTAS